MDSQSKTSKWQIFILVSLRFLIGWHLLFEGIYKLIHPQWSSLGFLVESQWILSWFAEWIASSENILNVVDFLNTWGLIAIGLGLMLGLFTRIASIAGAALLVLYYLLNPPFIGLELTAPMEGNYLIVNKTIIEAAVLILLALFPASRLFGLDSLLKNSKYKQ